MTDEDKSQTRVIADVRFEKSTNPETAQMHAMESLTSGESGLIKSASVRSVAADPAGEYLPSLVPVDGPGTLTMKEKIGRAQARLNVEDWGQQPPGDLVLAMAEELGELAAEVRDASEPGDEELAGALDEVVSLGESIKEALEGRCETDNGEPLPEGDRGHPFQLTRITAGQREEFYDLLALMYQFDWSLYQSTGDGDDR